MMLQNEHELAVTREKLRMLQESYAAARCDTSGGRYVQELELRSLMQLINQLQEEIVRFKTHEAHHAESVS